MNIKKNDWLAAIMFQPDATLDDFAQNNITPDNTTLKPIEDYKNIPEVINAFTEDGKFNEDKFTSFYNSALKVYNDYAKQDFESKILERYEYDPFDYLAPAGSKVKDINPKITKISNPFGQQMGIEALGINSDPVLSVREVAQANRVFNYETKTWENWTPNDKGGIINALSRPTLVLATYDEDGTHEVNNRIVHHSKGDLKYDESGKPYYETLGDRDIYGKTALTIEDTLTTDGSVWNKFDLFDSDGLDKSVGGTIGKLAIKVVPLLIPGVGKIYGALTASTELAKLVPTILKSIYGIFGNTADSDFVKSLNKVESYAHRFDSSVSDYSQQNIVSFENLGKLITDTSMQLFQQKAIAEIPRILKSSEPTLRTKKLGQTLALGYMAGTSAQDAYGAFKEAGANDAVAGLGMLSVMGGMYGLMNMDYFRKFLFKNSYLDRSDVKTVVKDFADEVNTNMAKWSTATPKQSANFVLKGTQWVKNRLKYLSQKEITGSALNEATEEVMEEVSSDAIKALYSAGSALGINMTENNQSLNFNFSLGDMAQRYAMSFFGGAIGGPIFHLHGKWQDHLAGISNNLARNTDHQTMHQLVYMMRQGRTDEIRQELDYLHSKGRLGDTNLSGKSYTINNTDGESTIQFLPAQNNDSQNDVVYELLNDFINRMETVMAQEGLLITDEDLTLALQAKQAGRYYDPILEKINSSGVYSRIFDDINNIAEEIIRTSAKISSITAPKDTESKTPSAENTREQIHANNLEVQKLNQRLADLRKRRDEILNGERSGYYLGQTLFALNDDVHRPFVNVGLNDYTKALYGKDFNSLTEEEQKDVTEKFNQYSKLDEKQQVYKAYDLFLSLNKFLAEDLKQIGDTYKDTVNVGFIGANTIYNLNEEIKNITAEITRVQNDPNGNEEELKKLTDKLDQLNKAKQLQESNLSSLLAPELEQPALDILQRPEYINQENIDTYANNIRKYYTHLRDNRLSMDFDDVDLNELINATKIIFGNPIQKYIDWHSIKTDDYSFIDGREEDDFINDTYYSVGHPKFNKLLDELFSNLGTNNEVALAKYNELLSFLNDSLLTEEEKQDLLNTILPQINGQNIVEYVKSIYNIKKDISLSPVYNLLNKFMISLGKTPSKLLDILSKEHSRFINSKNLQDYVIENEYVTQQLTDLNNFISALSSIIFASTNINDKSFNSIVNSYNGDSELAEIDFNTAQALHKDIELLSNKINFLLKISSQNAAQKLRIQKDIAINMRQKFVESLIGANSLIKKKFNLAFNVDVDKIWSDLSLTEVEITEENFDEYEQTVIKFETELFDQVYQQGFSTEEIANKLTDLFSNSELYKQKSTKLDPETKNVTDYDTLIYLASILTVPSSNFYQKLNDTIEKENFDKASIFSQEHAVRIGYAMWKNKELFNAIINKLVATDGSEYIKSRLQLYNFSVTFGGAGTGKTTSIGYLLKSMISDSSVITIAPTEEQVKKLNTALKVDGKVGYNKNAFIQKILGRGLTESDYELHDSYITLKSDTFPIETEVFDKSAENKVVFIDEISYFSRPELELIRNWAISNNVMIFAFGDLKQNSVSTIVNGKPIYGGIEDTYRITSPNLVASLRPNVIAKYDNYVIFNSLLESVLDKYADNPDADISYLNTETSAITKQQTLTKYFEDNITFVGEKIITNNNDVFDYINKFKSISTSIAIITDNPEKYTAVEDVAILRPDEAQGNEFDFVIVDKQLDRNNPFLLLRDIYTLTQRSTYGTIVLDPDSIIKNTLNVESIYDELSNANISLDENFIKDFQQWRTRSFVGLQPSELYVDTIETPNDPPISSDEENNVESSKETQIPDIPTDNPVVPKETNVTSNDNAPTSQTNNQPQPHTISTSERVVNRLNLSQSVGKTALVSDNDDILYWYDTNFWKDEIESDTSLYNVFNLKNVDSNVYKQYVNTLACYFKFGHYKNKNNVSQLRNTLLQLLPRENRMLQQIISNINDFTFEIIPHKSGKGLLVANLKINDRIAQIPLLFTTNTFGVYNGEIIQTNGVSFISDGNVNTDIPSLNVESNFKVFSDYVIPVITTAQKDSVNQATREFVWDRGNNGKLFGLVTDDVFISETEILKNLSPTFNTDGKVTYLIQNNNVLTLFGAQQVLTVSKIVETVRGIINERNNRLNEASKNERANIFKQYEKPNNQVLNLTRTGQVITELINLSLRNPEIESAILGNMFDHLKTDRSSSKTRVKGGIKISLTLGERQNYLLLNEERNGDDVLVLYKISNENNTLSSEVNVYPMEMRNVYEIIQKIYASPYVNLIDNYFDPRDIQISLVDYGYKKQQNNQWVDINQIYNVSSNQVVYSITKGIENLEVLDWILENSELFINGVYIQDVAQANPLGTFIYPLAKRSDSIYTDVKKFNGSTFIIDKSKIIPNVNAESLMDERNDKLKEFLAKNNIPFDDSVDFTQESFDNLLTNVNAYLKTNTITPNYHQIIYHPESDMFELKIEKDIENLIKNKLNSKNIDYVNIQLIPLDITLNFIPFYVTLSDSSKIGFYLSNDGTWNLYQFNSIDSYNNLLNYFNEHKDINYNIRRYVNDLINNIDIDPNEASVYYITVNNTSDPILIELNQKVNTYLLEKLKNNEC